MKSKFFKQSRNETTKKEAIMKVSEIEDDEYSSRQVMPVRSTSNKKMVINEKQQQTIIQEQNIASNNGHEMQQEMSL